MRDYISWMRNFIRRLPSLCISYVRDLAIQKRGINISLIEQTRERERGEGIGGREKERERKRERERIKGCAGLKESRRNTTRHNTGMKKDSVVYRLKMKFHG